MVAAAVAVVSHPRPFGIDADALRWSLDHSALLGAAKVVTAFGAAPWAEIVALVGLLAGRAWRAPRRLAVLLALAIGFLLLRHGLAAGFARPRPPRGDWAVAAAGGSFPSGHTATASIVAALVFVAWQQGPGRRPVAVVGLLLALAVGLSRVVLRVHWLTDVIGGWAFGLLYAGVAVLLLLRLPKAR